ncbi:MAG: hypothetical protein HC817_14495 [Saprospiraceae bacterium]|nr:hypothetical protein [Saprospiraceae bacterium]
MCGISGILDFKKSHLAPPIAPSVAKMNDRMRHRGPDDAGIWAEKNIALGQRRLSIIDLSPAGHQPMLSHDERFVITFNGEIYNFKKLKNQISDYPFRSNSDTEVLLAAYAQKGKNILSELNGMFAFAVWDRAEEELLLARDQLGIKPLYYVLSGERLIFASEIRALLASDLVKKNLMKPLYPII